MTTKEENRPTNENRRGVNWDDPDIPAGNSPPLPSWPLWLSGLLWGGSIAYLLVTAAAA